jgi:hypothetical protein
MVHTKLLAATLMNGTLKVFSFFLNLCWLFMISFFLHIQYFPYETGVACTVQWSELSKDLTYVGMHYNVETTDISLSSC